jgi:hypothetical protein
MFEMARGSGGGSQAGSSSTRAQFDELLRRGANPAAVEKGSGDTPLHVAARAGAMDVVKVLLDFESNLRAKNQAGETPLDVATPAVASHLKSNRVQRALAAAKRGDVAGVRREIKLLCEQFGGSKRSRGIIALHGAATAGRQAESVMDWALSVGVDIDAEDAKGRVALMLACGHGRVATVTKLLGAGARANLVDYSGNAARDYAMSCERHSRMLEYIVRRHDSAQKDAAAAATTTAPASSKALCASIYELSAQVYRVLPPQPQDEMDPAQHTVHTFDVHRAWIEGRSPSDAAANGICIQSVRADLELFTKSTVLKASRTGEASSGLFVLTNREGAKTHYSCKFTRFRTTYKLKPAGPKGAPPRQPAAEEERKADEEISLPPPPPSPPPLSPPLVTAIDEIRGFVAATKHGSYADTLGQICTALELAAAATNAPAANVDRIACCLVDPDIFPLPDRVGSISRCTLIQSDQDDAKNSDAVVVPIEARRTSLLPQLSPSSLSVLFRCFGLEEVLRLCICILMEQSIILLCSSPEQKGVHCAEALMALCFPWEWPHTFVPFLPYDMADHIGTPGSSFFGIHSRTLDRIPGDTICERVIANADTGSVVVPIKVISPGQVDALDDPAQCVLPEMDDVNTQCLIAQVEELLDAWRQDAEMTIIPDERCLLVRCSFLLLFMDLLSPMRPALAPGDLVDCMLSSCRQHGQERDFLAQLAQSMAWEPLEEYLRNGCTCGDNVANGGAAGISRNNRRTKQPSCSNPVHVARHQAVLALMDMSAHGRQDRERRSTTSGSSLVNRLVEERKLEVNDEVLAIVQARDGVSATDAAKAAVVGRRITNRVLPFHRWPGSGEGRNEKEAEKEEEVGVTEKKEKRRLGFRSWFASELEMDEL